MTKSYSRRAETFIYVAIWSLVLLLWVLNILRTRSYSSGPLIDAKVMFTIGHALIPLIVLFLINNYILIPKLLMRGKGVLYFFSALLLVGSIWSWQWIHFLHEIRGQALPPHHIGPPDIRPLLPFPLFLDLIFDLIVLSANLTVALLCQRYYDRLERESLMKSNAQSQLAYLKAQINPHFYMNMLNNIHGMIELDPPLAQEMLLQMSGLMRYMLYDSSRESISLESEIGFLNDYISLMRRRYPQDKVAISSSFPDRSGAAGVTIPPLLYLVFIENAFKHGVSYREDSYISIEIKLSETKVEFHCLNSIPTCGNEPREHGIGLQNIQRRLNLIYGDKAHLTIDKAPSTYSVILTVPFHATVNHNN